MMNDVIRTKAIAKVYPLAEPVRALGGVDLTVTSGELVTIMGASGSGKSTLMGILGCLDRPTAGRYWLNGTEVSRLSARELADIRNREIGFVFQGFNLLSRTSSLDNVLLPLIYERSGRIRDPRRRAIQALERVGLGDRCSHEPSQLSGGQQQRVAIARALVNEPALILADEPTGNLDSRTTIEMMALFQQLNDQGITILLVTHDVDVAEYAKRIVELKDGFVVRDEPVTRRRIALDDLGSLGEVVGL